MHFDVTPEALAAASAQVTALTARLIGTGAAQTVANGIIGPAGSDISSIRTAAFLKAKGAEHDAMAAMGNSQLALSSYGVAESGSSYTIGEAEAVSIYTAAGGAGV